MRQPWLSHPSSTRARCRGSWLQSCGPLAAFFLWLVRSAEAIAKSSPIGVIDPPPDFRRRQCLSHAGKQTSRTRVIVPAPNVVRSEVRSANPRTKSSRLYSARNGRIGRQRTASGRVQFPAYSRVSAAHSGGRTACPGEARPTVGSDRRERPHGRRVGSWGQPSHRLVTEDSPLAMPCSLIPPQAP